MPGSASGSGGSPLEDPRGTLALMQCPQCGAETPDDAWNCVVCRVNVYWASRHYDDLARIRDRQGLPAHAQTPPFLIGAHERVMTERAERGGAADSKVRDIARRAMAKKDA